MNLGVQRFIVPMAAVTAVALTVAWFPLRTMLSQSAQLSSASQQVSTLNAESQQLAAEQRALASDAAETRLARQDYQLVAPGQRLIQILLTSPSSTIGNGDPGLQPLVSPMDVRDLVPASATAPPATTSTGFWSRLERTLQFWR